MRNYWPLKTKPMDVQSVAFDKGRDLPKFGDWIEQGMGKSALNCADFIYGLHRDRFHCNVVVAPAYLKSGWADEVEKHVGPDMPVFTWPDVPTDRQKRDPYFQIMNTESALDTKEVSRRGGRYLRGLLASTPCMLTIDEAVCVANFKSNITSSVIALAREAKVTRLLSGLPTPENVMQWWSLLRILGEINGINPYAFRNRYAKMGGYMGKKCTGYRDDTKDELFEIIDRSGIRAMKEDWLDLPPKVSMPPIEFEMAGKQLAAYRSMLVDFYAEVDRGEVYADQVIHQLMKLQQITRGFLKDGETIHELVPPAKNPAILALKDVLSRTPGKTLVFTYHEYSTRTVFYQLRVAGRHPIVLRGGLTTDEIKERKAAFNCDPEVRDAVLQLTVGSKGHTMLGDEETLTGDVDDRCYNTFFYENLYSRDVRSQAEDRNHRIGQNADSVNYFDLVERAPGSPTRKAIKALQLKQDFVDATINAMRTRRPTNV